MSSIDIARLDSSAADFDVRLDALLDWDAVEDAEVERIVVEIISRVRKEGDSALIELTRRFDRLDCNDASELALGPEEFADAWSRLPEAEQDALNLAAGRIRRYHEHQLDPGFSFTDEDGSQLGQRITAMDRVGIYVPGGQATYPSTVLMTAIPARVAGVGEVVMVVPTPDGARSDLVMGAAHVAGVDRAFTVGGAQAIAALAYGTETLPRVDKIVGPGGVFVAAAKRRVFGQVGIDVIAGPSEVLIVTDGSAPPEWLAYDLFSQAEHDAAAQALLLCPDPEYLDRVAAAMDVAIAGEPRRDTILASLGARGALIRTRSIEEALALSNRIAPEHLELCLAEPRDWLDQVRHAGAVFLGAYSPEVMGDYSAGPSHVLPTYGTARFSSPLGVYDFQKRSSVIQLSRAGAEKLARASMILAEGEGLSAHAHAAAARIADLDHNRS